MGTAIVRGLLGATRPRGGFAAVALVCLVTACTFEPQPISGGLTCNSSGACPEGFTCKKTDDYPKGLCCAAGDVSCGGRLSSAASPDAGGKKDGTGGTGDPLPDAGPPGSDTAPEPMAESLIGCDATLIGACPTGSSCKVQCLGATMPGIARTVCTPAGTVQTNQACALANDCTPGTRCVGPVGCAAKTYCRPNCKIDADCGGGGICLDVTCSGQSAPFGVCTTTCDPVAGAGCGEGQICTLKPGDRTDCECRDGAAGGDGAVCTTTADCQSGFMCLERGGTSVCRHICRIGTADCTGGTSCVVIPQSRAFGACVLPAADKPPACDPALASSCSMPGTGCDVVCDAGAKQSAMCVARGNKGPMELCPKESDCAPGNTCLATKCADGTSVSSCKKHCKSDADCGGGTARCNYTIQCGMTVGSLFGICSFSCDPRGAATFGCPTGTNCLLKPHEETDCRCRSATQIGKDGQVCTGISPCEPGLTCVQEGSRRLCRPICRLDMPGTCSAGRTCRATTDLKIFGACMP